MKSYWIAFNSMPGLERIYKRCDTLEEAKAYDTGRGRPNSILLFNLEREEAYMMGGQANQRASWWRTDPAVVSKQLDEFMERD